MYIYIYTYLAIFFEYFFYRVKYFILLVLHMTQRNQDPSNVRIVHTLYLCYSKLFLIIHICIINLSLVREHIYYELHRVKGESNHKHD